MTATGETATTDAEDAAAWDAWEVENWDREERDAELRCDLTRIRGYALFTVYKMRDAREVLERACDALARAETPRVHGLAKGRAERALRDLRWWLDQAERACAFASRAMAGDVAEDVRREAATALEEMFG